ncbi:response regulator [Synergistales bacterium]|nr:response regulator [Synergistales bacterium]
MKQILVVDDNMVSLKQVAAQLSGNYEFSLTKSGKEALSICAAEKPDLILLDVNMPDMDGFETLEQLKLIPGIADVPVIFLTGDSSVETESKALMAGARDFIVKPVDKSILHHRLEVHLQLHEYQSNLESMMWSMENSIVISFADLLECRDNNSGGHVLRTSKYVGIIGKELISKGKFADELNESVLSEMVRAAPFHDIGKIAVSDVLLHKAGALTEEEYALVKEHTVIGARVMERIYMRTPTRHYLLYAIMMAEGHHERYDGKGYPRGLKGEEIPLCCRLMSVANVYDACLTDRPYRRALSPEEAFGVVMEGKGTELDPEVVEALETCYPKLSSLNEPSFGPSFGLRGV